MAPADLTAHLLLLDARHRLYEWNLDALREELAKLGLAWTEW